MNKTIYTVIKVYLYSCFLFVGGLFIGKSWMMDDHSSERFGSLLFGIMATIAAICIGLFFAKHDNPKFKFKQVWMGKESKKLCIGNTANCVNCGKQLPEGEFVGCSYLKNNKGEIIMAHFCNDLCLRDLYFKHPNWHGMTWIEDYGIIKHAEPFELH